MADAARSSVRRAQRVLRLSLGITAALLLFGARASARGASWLALPFENKTRQADYHWMGEACALLLSELLVRAGESVVSPDDRRALYEQLRLPTGLVVTRASALVVAERLGAERLLVGTYQVTGPRGQERVAIAARVIHVAEARMLTNELTLGAPLRDLPALLATLVGEVLGDRLSPSARQAVAQMATALPTSALEYYTKAWMAADPQVAIPLLRRAERAAGRRAAEYAPLLLELGRAYVRQGQCADALPYLHRLTSDASVDKEAQFYLGVCALQQGDWTRAVDIYRALARVWPLAEVYNNLAVAELRLGQTAAAAADFSQALGRSGPDPDIRFNYGYALWKLGEFESAAGQFRQVVRQRTADAEAHYLLAKSLQRLGRAEEAQGALTIARRSLPAFAEWENMADPPIAPRLKLQIARPQARGAIGLASRALAMSPAEAVRQAEALLEAGREEEALGLVESVLRTAPDQADAHLLKARLYFRRGSWREAADAAQAAAFWNPRLISAHLLLARIYLAVGERERARLSVERALALDPNDAEARELAQELAMSSRKP